MVQGLLYFFVKEGEPSMDKLMKDPKPKANSRKKEHPQLSQAKLCPTTRRDLYLEHLMGMTVGLLGHELQKG